MKFLVQDAKLISGFVLISFRSWYPIFDLEYLVLLRLVIVENVRLRSLSK